MGELLSLFDEPAPAVKRRQPREYQRELFDAWAKRSPEHRGHLAVQFTGAGKTYEAAEIIKRQPGRCLYVVNRNTLRSQAMDTLMTDSGKRWQLEQGDAWASVNGDSSVVALIQTLVTKHAAGKRYMRFAPDTFGLIVVDEVHQFMAPEARAFLAYFTGATLLGFTATPAGKAYQPLFTNVLANYPLARALADAWSVDFEYRTYETEVNLDGVKWRGGDWSREDLDQAMTHAAGAIAKAALEECDDLKTLVFCPGIKAIEAATDAINKVKPDSARMLHSKLPDTTKLANVRDYKAGKFQYLVSCDMVREGFDDVYTQCILLAKPMGQPHDYEQVIGRGSRLWPGVGDIQEHGARRLAIEASPKPRCRLVDLACVSEKHHIVSVVDVLGGDYNEAERRLAKKALEGKAGKDKSGGRPAAERDPAKMLAWARQELAWRAEAAEKARLAKEATKLTRKAKAEKPAPDGPMTEGQKRKLAEFGVTHDPGLTQAEATQLIRREFLATSRGWVGFKERLFAEKWFGVKSAWGMPRAKYVELAEKYRAGGYKPLRRA